ncbi:MAG: C39 family peptidase [Chlorobi bacterium]|nr:MAG: hypothetical protein UZ07_CHB004001385 [Chlorobi bacterium OLB7]MBK8911258.1 C39 family peptidase [Chlorobiota bacterium]
MFGSPHPSPLKRAALIGGVLMIVATIAAAVIRDHLAAPISISGGEPMEMALMDIPLYLQTAPQWKEVRLGGSNEAFSSTGCVVCCVSMALAHHGIAIPPDVLNAQLALKGGFTERGWLRWRAVEELTNHAITIETPYPSHQEIDDALKAGNPVIVRVMIGAAIPHWVLVVGKRGMEYLMNDPLGEGIAAEPLRRFRSEISAVRIVRKNG